MRKFFALLLLVQLGVVAHAQQSSPAYRCAKGFRYIDTVLNASETDRFVPVLIAFVHFNACVRETMANYDSLKQPVHLIIPVGNCNSENASLYFPTTCYEKGCDKRDRMMRKTVDSIADFIHAINQQYHCRSFVSGFQQGGDLAIMLAIYHPQQVVASFPLAAVAPRKMNMMLKSTRDGYVPIYLYKGGSEEPVAVQGHASRLELMNGFHETYLAEYPAEQCKVSARAKQDYSAVIDEQLYQYRINFSESRLDKFYPATATNTAVAGTETDMRNATVQGR